MKCSIKFTSKGGVVDSFMQIHWPNYGSLCDTPTRSHIYKRGVSDLMCSYIGPFWGHVS